MLPNFLAGGRRGLCIELHRHRNRDVHQVRRQLRKQASSLVEGQEAVWQIGATAETFAPANWVRKGIGGNSDEKE